MSGHSKWNNIKRKKEKTDAQRAKIFTKMGREISVAVREGGPDPTVNSKLRDIINKAKAANYPAENIDRIIKKASGDGKDEYETITYEGYGPGGIALMVETLTDNRNRTAADVRHYFDKFGGNLGTNGCVSFMFTQKGVLLVETDERSEDAVLEDCLEAGGDEMNYDEEECEIVTTPNDLRAVTDYFEGKGYKIISSEPEYVPSNYTRLSDEEQLKKMGLLLEHLEDNDDVQNVWHNLENEEDLPE